MFQIIENPLVLSNVIANQQIHELRRLKEQAEVLYPQDRDVIENIKKTFPPEVVEHEPRARKLVGQIGIIDNKEQYILTTTEWQITRNLMQVCSNTLIAAKFFKLQFGWPLEKGKAIANIASEHPVE